MELKEAIKILEYHNKWRRDVDDKYKFTDPKELGIAIDVIVNDFKSKE